MSANTLAVSKNTQEYKCRKPQYSPYYQCIEDNYETFERVYERKYQEKFGYLRQIVSKVIYQYLDCGILHNGFARINAVPAIMNICLSFPANGAISAHHVMLRGWLSLESLPA
jgi:hypothetical protein